MAIITGITHQPGSPGLLRRLAHRQVLLHRHALQLVLLHRHAHQQVHLHQLVNLKDLQHRHDPQPHPHPRIGLHHQHPNQIILHHLHPDQWDHLVPWVAEAEAEEDKSLHMI
jgi:hypothetical protein